MNIGAANWYPVYLNPDFGEILTIAKSGWDTIRILAEQPHGKVIEDTAGDIVLASGYGNTHESVMRRYAIYKGATIISEENERTRWRGFHKVPSTVAYILYKECGYALFNLEDCSGSSRARYNEWSKYFYAGHVEILKDLIRESDLSL